MQLEAKMILADTAPLITLACAECLDYLLLTQKPLLIPDAVFYEASVKSSALGANEIVDWVQQNYSKLNLIVTQTYTNFLKLKELNAQHKERDLGERAALEVMRYTLNLKSHERAIFIVEDDRALRSTFSFFPEDRQRFIGITTRDYLEGLENAQLINSATQVFIEAQKRGRQASQKFLLENAEEAAQDAVKRLFIKND